MFIEELTPTLRIKQNRIITIAVCLYLAKQNTECNCLWLIANIQSQIVRENSIYVWFWLINQPWYLKIETRNIRGIISYIIKELCGFETESIIMNVSWCLRMVSGGELIATLLLRMDMAESIGIIYNL